MRIRWALGALLVSVGPLFGQQPSETRPAAEVRGASSVPLFPIERQLLEHTNAQRVRYGLQPLELDPQLQQSARQHCYWMARTGSLQHTTAPVAENIAMGQRTTQEAIRDWLNSPGHRANMLHRDYTRVGVAAYQQSDGTIFWCQQFLR
jgi:uncharacterized protein YkwD